MAQMKQHLKKTCCCCSRNLQGWIQQWGYRALTVNKNVDCSTEPYCERNTGISTTPRTKQISAYSLMQASAIMSMICNNSEHYSYSCSFQGPSCAVWLWCVIWKSVSCYYVVVLKRDGCHFEFRQMTVEEEEEGEKWGGETEEVWI
jgi:hypothetical protein